MPEARPDTMMAGRKDHFAAATDRLPSSHVSSSPLWLVVTCGSGSVAAAQQASYGVGGVGVYGGDGVGVAPCGRGPGGWQRGPSRWGSVIGGLWRASLPP